MHLTIDKINLLKSLYFNFRKVNIVAVSFLCTNFIHYILLQILNKLSLIFA